MMYSLKTTNITLLLELVTYKPLQSFGCHFDRAGNLRIRSSLIHSFAHFAQFKWATVRDLLRSLKTNERPWANRSEEMSDREWFAHFAQIKWGMWANPSFCSPKMSEQERFAQVAQRKWAMWANRSFLDKKRAIRSEIKWANSQPCILRRN